MKSNMSDTLLLAQSETGRLSYNCGLQIAQQAAL